MSAKRVAVIGAGASGQAAARYWQALGARVTVHDRKTDVLVPAGAQTVLGEGYLRGLSNYDLIVRSPGVRPGDLRVSVPVTTGVREFFARCPAQIIGITGTRGKTTVARLVMRMLGEAGRRTWFGGDGEVSPLDFLDKVRATHIVILELSTFQLMDLDGSPHIGVCLRVEPEDMDWHGNTREYVAAKGNLFWHQRSDDIAIYDGTDELSMQIARLSPGLGVPFLQAPGARVEEGVVLIADTAICNADEIALSGSHRLENACAAVTIAWQMLGGRKDPIRRALLAFRPADEGDKV